MGHVQETEEIEDVDTFDDFEIECDYVEMKDKVKKEEIK